MLKNINIKELHSFPENPFKVRENEDFTELVESVKQNGVITPIVARAIESGGYEIVSGHRRAKACEVAGIVKIPAVIFEKDRNAAIIALVDSNIHRENILPSERAFAYKLKLDALNHQGKRTDLTSVQVEEKLSVEVVAESASVSTAKVQRYIRLTNLIPELLQMVDESKIAVSPAVEISYLPREEQANLLITIDSEERTPSLSQAQRMKKLYAEGNLNMDAIFSIMTEEKPNEKEQIKLKAENIKTFFPKNYTVKQMEDIILKLLAEWQKRRERNRQEER